MPQEGVAVRQPLGVVAQLMLLQQAKRTGQPDLHAEVGTRITCGPFAFDHEKVTRNGGRSEVVAIYEVKDGLIHRVWFARP